MLVHLRAYDRAEELAESVWIDLPTPKKTFRIIMSRSAEARATY